MCFFSLQKTARWIHFVLVILIVSLTLEQVSLIFYLSLFSLFIVEGIPVINRFLGKKGYRLANLIHSTYIDIFAKVLSICLAPFPQTQFDPKEDEGQIPTILIHGYLNNSAIWIYHRYRYHCAGLNNIYTVNLGSPFESIENYAEVLRKRILEVSKITGQKKVRLLGHSLGGVVAAYYILHLANDDGIEVVDLMTMGSPLHGTPLGVFGPGKSPKQMRKASPFIKELSRKLEQSHIRCFHQGSKTDVLVFPFDVTYVRSKGEHEIRCYDDLGHVSFLFSDRVIQAIIRYLRVDRKHDGSSEKVEENDDKQTDSQTLKKVD